MRILCINTDFEIMPSNRWTGMITLMETRESKDQRCSYQNSLQTWLLHAILLPVYKVNCSMAFWMKQLCKATYWPPKMHNINSSWRQQKCLVSLICWDTRAAEPSRITRARAHIQRLSLKIVAGPFFQSSYSTLPSKLHGHVCVIPLGQQWYNLTSKERRNCNLPSCWYDMSPGSIRVVPSSVILSTLRPQVRGGTPGDRPAFLCGARWTASFCSVPLELLCQDQCQ